MNIDDLVKAMAEAGVSKGTLQSSIRTFITEADDFDGVVAGEIAKALSIYRTKAEKWIHAEDDLGTISMRRKITNNICNDVSRISRELLGHTIKCTSRKDGHVYTSSPYLPPAKTTPKTGGVRIGLEEEIKYLRDQIEKLKNMTCDAPQKVCEELVLIHGREKAGQIMVDVLKNVTAED